MSTCNRWTVYTLNVINYRPSSPKMPDSLLSAASRTVKIPPQVPLIKLQSLKAEIWNYQTGKTNKMYVRIIISCNETIISIISPHKIAKRARIITKSLGQNGPPLRYCTENKNREQKKVRPLQSQESSKICLRHFY